MGRMAMAMAMAMAKGKPRSFERLTMIPMVSEKILRTSG